MRGDYVNYKVQHITNKRKIIRNMDPEHLTIHSTGNPNSTAQNERDNLNRTNNTTTTGFHIVVDDKEAIECIPLDKLAYHAGDGAYGPGNSKSIGLEICESGNRAKTIENAVKVAAKILYEKNWGIDRLKRHYDWSGKICPRILSQNNWEAWDAFKIQVQRELDNLNNVVKVNIRGTTHYIEGTFKNNKNYVAIRELLELLGYKVDWDSANKVVLIK